MSTSASPSKLPAWIFYASDLALLAAAAFIAAEAPRPLPNSAIFAVVACVIAGAILGTIPRLVAYEREKNIALDERQSAIEGLSQTIANSAEQISVAATGLHAIAELTHKHLRQAEQLPHKLHEKIVEFQAQLANASDAEKEELEKELATLRSSESERLDSISDRIAKSVTEFGRLQSQLQKQLAAAAALASTASSVATVRAPAATVVPPSPDPSPVSFSEPPAPTPPAAIDAVVEPQSESGAPLAPPPKTPRVARREETPPTFTAVTSVIARDIAADEPAPVQPLEIAPVVPESRSPYGESLGAKAIPSTPGATAVVEPAAAPRPARKRAEKKTAETSTENLLGLDLPEAATVDPALKSATIGSLVSDFAARSPAESNTAPVPSSDGATRLLITAYIGIGNRLFLRGEGPGLTWEKGVPLQFVSIGKWRWEAADLAVPLKFKLYKNDETECTVLGLQTLAPAHQQELSATF